MASMEIDYKYLHMAALVPSYDSALLLIDKVKNLRIQGFRLFHNLNDECELMVPQPHGLIFNPLSSCSLEKVIIDPHYRDFVFVALIVSQELKNLMVYHDLTIDFELMDNWPICPFDQRFKLALSGDEDKLLLTKLSMG